MRASQRRPLEGIDAVILAGGRGTRLQPVLKGGQKVLADVAGRPFLGKLIDFYRAAGAARIVLALGYRSDDVETFMRNFQDKADFIASVELEPLGTGGALRHALSHLRTPTVLVANGDSFMQADLGALLRLHCDRGSAITLALALVEDTGRYGRVLVDEAGAVTSFEEKATTLLGSPVTEGFINAGIYLIERSVIAAMPKDRPISLEREVFPQFVGRGLCALASRTPFIDIGTPESWASAEGFFASLPSGRRVP
jgi:NDP-sugar pyrophosphorylase family protein